MSVYTSSTPRLMLAAILAALAAFAALAALAACIERPDAGRDAVEGAALGITTICDPSGYCFEVMARPSTAEACPTDRMIGVRGGSICPVQTATAAQGRWQRANLFVADHVPSALQTFCLYTWVPSTLGAPPDTAALPPDTGSTVWLSPDCNVVSAQSTDMMDAIWPELRTAYFAQIDRLDPLPHGAQSPASTRVEVIDSAVTLRWTGDPSSGRLVHGRAVGLTIDRLACPGGGSGPCADFIASTLALQLERTSGGIVRDPNQGGFFGSQADLATAIFSAVDRWRAQAPADKLVINVSLGWDPIYGGDYSGAGYTALAGPVRAVHAAISYAVCSGALVIAAAGNQTGGPLPSIGPMYPAGWEQKSAPDTATCASFSFGGSGPPAGATYAPLVFSAGGVDGRDEALTNARPQGRPLLAAPAAEVIVADASVPEGYSQALTGTSMAAAGVSAAAAAVWGYRPGWTPYQVMSAVYGAAIDLGIAADYCLAQPCANIRRISVCGAIAAACAAGGTRCPAGAINCLPTYAYRNLTPPAPNASGLPLTATVDASGLLATRAVGTPCNATILGLTTNPLDPCVAEQYYATELVPWVGPQPEVPPCNLCTFNSTTLTISIDRNFVGTLTAPMLSLNLKTGNLVKIDLSSSVTTLAPGDTTKVINLKYAASDTRSATLDFLVDGQSSSSNPVQIW